MRVNIEHKEKEFKAGLFKKVTYPVVVVTVDFSETELESLKDEHMSVVLERSIPPNIPAKDHALYNNHYNLNVKDLIEKSTFCTYALRSIAEAKLYEEELIEALKNLKAFIEGNAEIEEEDKSKTFEL